MFSERGRISPLHNGQWLPHPAPEPVALTNAPHRITPMLIPRTAHEKFMRDRFLSNDLTLIMISLTGAIIIDLIELTKSRESE
jgi:hypothetical protein